MAGKNKIQLSDHFDYKTLFRFTLPSVLMMAISSVYSLVDGLFVSNFAGADAFAAVNLIMPFFAMGMVIAISSGVANVVLDALFVAVFPWGVAGAAAATVIGQVIGGIVPLVYFI